MNSNREILHAAKALGREKGIAEERILEIVAHAISKAAREIYGDNHFVEVKIDPKSGEVVLLQVLKVVDEVIDASSEISLAEAQVLNTDLVLGDNIYQPLPPMEISRAGAYTAKASIVEDMQNIEKEKELASFKDKIGKVVGGLVKRAERQGFIVDIGNAEGMLRSRDTVKGEKIRINDRIKVYIREINPKFSPQIQLSRTDNQMLAELFTLEVPEIRDGTIEIKGVARFAGSRAKIAVFSRDRNVDAARSCVGIRSIHLNSIKQELNGEKIDIVMWEGNLAQYVVNALNPNPGRMPNIITPLKIAVREDEMRIEVVIPSEQIARALGSEGQNVKLASKLLGWKLDLMTDIQASERKLGEFKAATNSLVQALELDTDEEVIAELLVVHGFDKLERIANASEEELSSIEGFDELIVSEIKTRAKNYLEHTEIDTR